MPVTDYETEIEEDRKTNKGPVCAECGKPIRLAADKGGCGCPRHPVRETAASPVKAAAERQAVAMEGILTELQKIARKLEAK